MPSLKPQFKKPQIWTSFRQVLGGDVHIHAYVFVAGSKMSRRVFVCFMSAAAMIVVESFRMGTLKNEV